MNPGQMSQMLGRINVGPGAGPMNPNMGNQMGPMNPNGMPQMPPNNMVPNPMGPNVMNQPMPMNQQQMGQNQMAGAPMGMNPMLNMQQQQHMARKPQEMMINNNQNLYQGKGDIWSIFQSDMRSVNWIFLQSEMLVLVNSFAKVQVPVWPRHLRI